MSMLLRRRLLVGGSPAYETISGAVASFQTKRAAPLQSLIATINPVQSGSGDPSPDNVRPISGFAAVEIQVSPYLNRFVPTTDYAVGDNIYDANGIKIDYLGYGKYHVYGSNSAGFTTTVIRCKEFTAQPSTASGRKFCIHNTATYSSSYLTLYLVKGSTNVTSWALNVLDREEGYNEAAGKTMDGWKLSFVGSGSVDFVMMPEFVDKGDDYQDIDITFPTPPDTVYGGTLDVLSGLLTVTHVSKTFDGGQDESWANNNGCFTIYVPGIKQSSTVNSNAKIVMCDTYKNGGAKYRDSVVNMTIVKTVGGNNQIAIKNTNYANASAFQAALVTTPIQVVYELATPVVYQLDPVTLASLKGRNNIWADTGNVSVTYRSN